MEFTITANAAKRINQLLAKDDAATALRIAVDGGGCSGFMYNYLLTDQIDAEDCQIHQHGVKVVIDPISQEFLNNCQVDFVEELGARYFQISNPNATAKCGCGNSFAV